MKLHKKITFIVWVGLILATVLLFVLKPELLQGENLKEFISANNSQLMLYYVIFSILRCFTLIPATPFIISGVLLFPNNLHFVMVVVLVSIILAATIHFKLSKYLGFDNYLEKKFASKMEKLKTGMQKRGFIYILLWTMAPFLPSDVSYYVAGISGMRYSAFISAVFLGGVALSGVYIYMGKGLFEWMFGL